MGAQIRSTRMATTEGPAPVALTAAKRDLLLCAATAHSIVRSADPACVRSAEGRAVNATAATCCAIHALPDVTDAIVLIVESTLIS